MGRGRFGPIFDVESISVELIYNRTLEVSGPDKISVKMSTHLVESGDNLLVGSTSLLALYEFLKSYKATTLDLDELYEKNVRRFLGSKGKVNKAMQATLRDKPEQFGLFNNGITLTVASVSRVVDGYELVEPYVVNGCQTTRTIWEVCQQKLESGGTGKNNEIANWKSRLSRGVVVTKIATVGTNGEQMLQDITRYTNSQNAVKEKDFLTLTSDFRKWAVSMADDHNVFLEVQRGGWESQRAKQKQRPGVKQFDLMANAFDLLKIYGSGWLGEAGSAFGRNAAFLPGGTIFKRIMAVDSDHVFGVDDLYAAFCMQQVMAPLKFGRTAEHSSRKQTKFLFPLVATELLKDAMGKLKIKPTTQNITRSILRLFSQSDSSASDALITTSIQAPDDYMDPGEENSIYNEPVYTNQFSNNLNSMLKWDGFGKSDEATPKFRALLGTFRAAMGMGHGTAKTRDLIMAAIK